MSLDTRARHAVRSLQESVVRATPPALPTVTRRHRASLVAGLIGALAIAFGSIALAAMLPEISGDDTATVTSLVGDPEIPNGELVVLPESGGEVEGIHQKNDTSTSAEPYTQFYGLAEPGTVVTASSSYGTADLEVGESGEFSLKLFFEGAPTGVTFPVTLTVGDQEYDFEFTWLWDPQNIEISAYQGYGLSDSPIPFEKFYGSAPPGTPVTITSAYGSAETEAGDAGEWFAKVWFEGQPMGESFPITVVVGDETFQFSYLWLFDGTIEVSVSQEGTTSDSPSPYTRFVGTAPVGTTIVATSEYGSADLVVGESGEFGLKVWFSNAPDGVKFPITLEVGGETYGTYYFTWYGTPGSVEVSITQYNTESWEAYPWVKFLGTAPAGTHVLATSEYGSADVEVGSDGSVFLKLAFSTLPPAGETFPVTVKVDGEFYRTYEFTSWFDGEAGVTVTQHNTETDAADPWVKFYGTAPVGTEIRIISPYGSWIWNTEAANWNSGQLFFETLPPAGQTFAITVKVNGETWGTYPFTSWYEGGGFETTVIPVVTSSSGADPFAKVEYAAPAGTTIQLLSAYGSTSLTVEATSGHLALFFSTLPPAGVPFPVTIKVDGDTFGSFEFTSYYGGTAVTASHAFFTSDLVEPYDDLWGTAPAGSQVKILSEYGSAEITVGSGGSWEKRQFFSGAPYNTQFQVTVKVNGETELTYWFTVLPPA